MHRLDGKLPMSQRAGLVEDHSVDLRQNIHIVGTLDEDTLARGTANAAEEREGHADDQGTGTGHHEEHQSTIEPGGEGVEERGGRKEEGEMRTERWDNGQGQGEEDDNGGVDPGKAGDERLAL